MSYRAKLALLLTSLLPATSLLAESDLKVGIARTKEALAQIEKMMLQTEDDMVKVASDRSLDFAGQEIKGFGTIKDASELAKAMKSGDYPKSIEKLGDFLAGAWGAFDPGGLGGRVDESAKLINDYFRLSELQMLRDQQRELLGIHHTLETQLYRLEGKNPKDLNKNWPKTILGDEVKQHEAFEKWLAANSISKEAIIQRAAFDDLTIVDPNPKLTQTKNIGGDGDVIEIDSKLVDNSHGIRKEQLTIVKSESVLTVNMPPGSKGNFWQDLQTAITIASEMYQIYSTSKAQAVPKAICSGGYTKNPDWNPYGPTQYSQGNYIPLCIPKKSN